MIFFSNYMKKRPRWPDLNRGERVKAKDLLYGVLLPSGAECCRTFAENISGSESAFVKLMNEKANQIGLKTLILPIVPAFMTEIILLL